MTGFGSFSGVTDNPTESLAQALNGQMFAGHEIRGVVLPVSYARGPAEAIREAREFGADLVLGFGVAVNRTDVCVERIAVFVSDGDPDNDGETVAMSEGPERVRATLDVDGLAGALGASLSDDAGRYVCNAWLYKVTEALDVPVGFVHVPAAGLTPLDVLDALRRWL